MKRSAVPPPPPAPLPPGRLGPDVLLPTSKKKAKVTTTPKTASPAPKDPEHVKDDAKLKNWWQQGTKRRNQKMRSIEHWLRFNQPNFMNMAVCDFTKQAVRLQESPSFHFRNEARKFEVIRYFGFFVSDGAVADPSLETDALASGALRHGRGHSCKASACNDSFWLASC